MAAAKGRIQRGGNRGGSRGSAVGSNGDGQRSHAESNPGYVKTPPSETTVNGVRCVNVDADSILALRDWYRTAGVK